MIWLAVRLELLRGEARRPFRSPVTRVARTFPIRSLLFTTYDFDEIESDFGIPHHRNAMDRLKDRSILFLEIPIENSVSRSKDRIANYVTSCLSFRLKDWKVANVFVQLETSRVYWERTQKIVLGN